jgi:NAD(P)-dependent dehydrogenase (short-subunit alcohol dehydrogenase family)
MSQSDSAAVSTIQLRDAVAVVTGGAGGIGRALGERLAHEGARVALVDLDAARAEEAAAGVPGAIGLGADVGDPTAVQMMVEAVEERVGPIDVYCSNAGVASGGGLGDDADWELSWRVHGMAHVHAARFVVPGMVSRRSGAFVVTASAAGLLMMMQSAPYTVTKHASVAIAEWLAVQHGGEGVQFHCLCPQGVRTPMVAADPRGEKEVASSGRILEPDEVAGAVVDALRANRFLILPHSEVHDYEKVKVEDRDRWLAGMRRLLARVRN